MEGVTACAGLVPEISPASDRKANPGQSGAKQRQARGLRLWEDGCRGGVLEFKRSERRLELDIIMFRGASARDVATEID